MLHQETDGIATASATEAFINFLCGRNRERGCLFIMKGTKAQVIGSPLFQFHKSTNNLRDIDATEYLLYGLL